MSVFILSNKDCETDFLKISENIVTIQSQPPKMACAASDASQACLILIVSRNLRDGFALYFGNIELIRLKQFCLEFIRIVRNFCDICFFIKSI